MPSERRIRSKSTDENKIKSTLPVAECPSCQNSIYPVEITFICEKCSEIFYVPADLMEGYIHFCKNDLDNMNEYLSKTFNKKKALEFNKTIVPQDENNLQIFKISLKGRVLETFKQIKSIYSFEKLEQVIHLVIEGFVFVLKEIRKLPGDRIYLVDNLGNKSPEIKKGFLNRAEKSFNQEQDSYLVSQYLEKIDMKFKIEELKKKDYTLFSDEI